MVKLSNNFSLIGPINALVIGDLMLDKYTIGKVSRISPEAPVSILKVDSEKILPGGAGNVVLNFLSMGSNVKILSRLGLSLEDDILANELKNSKADINHLYSEKNYKTPIKNRLIADSQQLLRVDNEDLKIIDLELEKKIIKDFDEIFKDIQIVAISDYAKGFLSDNLLKEIINYANDKNILTIVDPKGNDFSKYKNAYLIKPNFLEAYSATNSSFNRPLNEVAQALLEITNSKYLLITNSKDGMSLFDRKNNRYDFPVISKELKDPTGAGDTVLAMLCICLANNINIKIAPTFCNIAAGIAIEQLGCAKVDLSSLARRMLKIDSDNKIFDSKHLYALKKAIKNTDFSILEISSNISITSTLFQNIKKLSDSGKKDLIVYINDDNPKDDFISFLSSLNEISFIILNSKNYKSLIKEIKPGKIFQMK
ncbi:MAG: Bifunctional protein HldE [Candidatus Anoxychlamydiales bacterium]|nr:Bifunctional protein HldE [Candidatus Anoxychlamydiales bacterium]